MLTQTLDADDVQVTIDGPTTPTVGTEATFTMSVETPDVPEDTRLAACWSFDAADAAETDESLSFCESPVSRTELSVPVEPWMDSVTVEVYAVTSPDPAIDPKQVSVMTHGVSLATATLSFD